MTSLSSGTLLTTCCLSAALRRTTFELFAKPEGVREQLSTLSPSRAPEKLANELQTQHSELVAGARSPQTTHGDQSRVSVIDSADDPETPPLVPCFVSLVTVVSPDVSEQPLNRCDVTLATVALLEDLVDSDVVLSGVRARLTARLESRDDVSKWFVGRAADAHLRGMFAGGRCAPESSALASVTLVPLL